MKYSIRVLLFCCMLLSGSCTKHDANWGDEEPIKLSLNFNSWETSSSRTLSTLSTKNNEESFIKTLRIIVFSATGEKIYNNLFTPEVHQTWTAQIYIKPGNYSFYAVANECSSMTEELNKITEYDNFNNLTSLKQVKREDGTIRHNNKIEAFLMKGETKNVEVNKTTNKVDIPLKRLLAKVEICFENQLSPNVQGSFNSFILGDFPRYFSVFDEGSYPISIESADDEKQWKIENVKTNQSYIHYIPPYIPKATAPAKNEEITYLHFLFNWSMGGLQFSEKHKFRESDQTLNEYSVKSNYHYKYTIRLSKAPQNPLEVQCEIAPWVEEIQQDYYIDDQCNLKIERDGNYIKFILQHVNQDSNFDFPSELYFIEFKDQDNVVWDSYVKYNYDPNEKEVGYVANWDGYNQRYILPFKQDGQGKSVIYIRYSGRNSYYARCYFNRNHIYDLQK